MPTLRKTLEEIQAYGMPGRSGRKPGSGHGHLENVRVAHVMHKFAERYENRGLRSLDKNDEDGMNKEMTKMYKGDANNFRKIGDYIQNGNHAKAARIINNLDTSPREEIPREVYRHIERNAPGKLDWDKESGY